MTGDERPRIRIVEGGLSVKVFLDDTELDVVAVHRGGSTVLIEFEARDIEFDYPMAAS